MQHPRLLTKIHEYLRSRRATEKVPAVIPSGAGAVRQKVYTRMPQVPLGAPLPLDITLDQALIARSSSHDAQIEGVISAQQVATVLSASLRVRTDGKRPYPSGGACYPIETYLINRTIPDLPKGVLHYSPATHTLEHLWEIPQGTSLFRQVQKASWAETASAVIVFTSVWNRSEAVYGDFSYILGLLEAGHMAQNIQLTASALGISSCPLAGFNDEEIINALDIDGTSEQPVYTIMLTHPQAR